MKNDFSDNARPSFAHDVPAGVSRNDDPGANAAAEEVIAILMGDVDMADEDEADTSFGVPLDLVRRAGVALANRHVFAIETDEDGAIAVMITPTRHFEETGYCSDQSGPVDDILPARMGNLAESQWEFYDPAIKTPLDAAKKLQDAGFVWNAAFQDFIDAKHTTKLEIGLGRALLPVEKGVKGSQPKFD